MASNVTIKAIDASAVHQIQAGQVIVDLCSVAKELVENSFDAGATVLDVRFKNHGLDSIEVQDNGTGIAAHNYESVALKHCTSKLESYDDLSTLETFGFRGEALSSLCALSKFSVVTCTQDDVPRASRLEFDVSGKLKSTSVVSGQRGTTVIVENLFRNLPVRRRELERNIKREWGKVINLLNQYACIQTNVKFTVWQLPTKGNKMMMFGTKGNPNTRENIINIFGVKTMNALVAMDLKLELIPTTGPLDKGKRKEGEPAKVRIKGFVSKPVHGEGRQTPDRQMFYVNGRPCGLPQFTKVFNEVYRSYNSSQLPFIFADIQLDTHLYDVNVSPDKRTILLHDQGQMLDNLRDSLIELFETQDVTIPVTQTPVHTKARFRPPTSVRSVTPGTVLGKTARATTVDTRQSTEPNSPIRHGSEAGRSDDESDEAEHHEEDSLSAQDEVQDEVELDQDVEPTEQTGASTHARPVWLNRNVSTRVPPPKGSIANRQESEDIPDDLESTTTAQREEDEEYRRASRAQFQATTGVSGINKPFIQPIPKSSAKYKQAGRRAEPDSNDTRIVDYDDYDMPYSSDSEPSIPAIPPPSQPPAPRSTLRTFSRPMRHSSQEVATITIGNHTVTSVIGNPAKRPRMDETLHLARPAKPSQSGKRVVAIPSFGQTLTQMFGSRAKSGGNLEITTRDLEVDDDEEEDEDMEIEDLGVATSDEEVDEDSLFVDQGKRTNAGSQSEGSIQGVDDGASVYADDRSDAEMIEGLEDPENENSQPDHEHPESDHGHHDAEDDDEYLDEEEKKAMETKKVQKMIETIEIATATEKTAEEAEKRTEMLLTGMRTRKDMTLNLATTLKTSEEQINQQIKALARHLPPPSAQQILSTQDPEIIDAEDAEENLSLKISKSDFGKMKIIGQFNKGFVIAVREASSSQSSTPSSTPLSTQQQQKEDDELFIIDQHASDEKYNFERLQSASTVDSQRLVHPKQLDLTPLEEETVLENLPALERNGFKVTVDSSGDKPVGSRCKLLSLPISRETTFSLADLEELIYLLGDNPTSSATTIPRPDRVRKMLAMRACRCSVMIGQALSRQHMEKIVRHMGEMDKPWNCPHGRPTMRHLCGLGGAWDGGRLWEEGNGFDEKKKKPEIDWKKWVVDQKGKVKKKKVKVKEEE
ncbi:mismatch repair endonuclease PMS2 [Podospora fimiseda]|uniref:DNA mismatch repair protein PMS1 n=1 Tax=Podospora fimiseda TaxID=252190 RepID=A0AAN7H3M5_9PEZI|nr:mismatch repair endonuclease PMS2 [Podospora fimiseda]